MEHAEIDALEREMICQKFSPNFTVSIPIWIR
jgi:hypothetical protein